MTPESILFVHSSDEPYGSDRVLLSVIDTALALGARIRVLLPDDERPGWLTRQLEERGVESRRVKLAPARRRYLRPGALPRYGVDVVRTLLVVRRELAAFPAQIVHINTTGVFAAALARATRARPVVWHVHELYTQPKPLAWLFRLLPMALANEVIAPSDAVVRNLRRSAVKRARVHRVYNGLAPRQSSPTRASHRLVCIFVGRLSHLKGYDLFVEAAADVARDIPQASFVMVGSPPIGEEWRVADLRRRIEEEGLSGRVAVVGTSEDVPALLDGAHVAVFPSRLPESFGLAALEAMRSGCAVIASDLGATPEIVTHERNGLLVPVDDPQSLTAALRRVLSDEALRDQLGRAGQESWGNRFSEETFRQSVIEVWRQVSAQGAQPPPSLRRAQGGMTGPR